MIINYFIRSHCNWEQWFFFLFKGFPLVQVNSLEVIVLALIKVREFPVDTDIFKGKIVPVIVVRVIGFFVIMNILALSPDSSELHKFSLVDFIRSASLVFKFSRNPASVDDDGSSIYFNRVFFVESTFE